MNALSDSLFGSLSLALMVSGCIGVEGSQPRCSAGETFSVAELSASEACDQFMTRLAETLGEADRGDIADPYEFGLATSGKGTITSVVSRSGAPQHSDYPAISVDAMDRVLNRGDIERLADAVAVLLLEQHGADRGTP